jgi:hypothetical protein
LENPAFSANSTTDHDHRQDAVDLWWPSRHDNVHPERPAIRRLPQINMDAGVMPPRRTTERIGAEVVRMDYPTV